MEPQLRRTDIHMEGSDKDAIELRDQIWHRLIRKQSTPRATVRQWPCEEAQQLCIVLVLFTSGPEFEWASRARGQPESENTQL